jgi:hypothetical protein
LWKDLLPAVQKRHPHDATDQCVELQRQVLAFVRKHFADFSYATIEPLLEIYPDNAVETYAERFEHTVWQGLLKLVYDFCGPCFQHDALTHFNHKEPSGLSAEATSTIAPSMCQVLESVPEIIQNPALRGKQAIKDLQFAIQPVVLRWAVEQCQRIIDAGEDSEGGQTLNVTKEQLDRYRRLLSAMEPSADREVSTSATTEVVAAGAESHTLGEAPSQPVTQPSTQPSTREARSTSELNRSRSPTMNMTERINPQLVPRIQVRKPQKALVSSSELSDNPRSNQTRRQDVHRDLDDILQLPPQPIRAKLSRTGRGWRFQPGVNAGSKQSK